MRYKHQIRFLEKKPMRSLLCWSTGTGKTIAGIEWANLMGENTLFIVPKALRQNWLRNIKEHQKGDKLYLVLTKEEFRAQAGTIGRFGAILCDEAHYFAGMKSQLSKILDAYIKKHTVRKILLMTATPYLSTPWNIYTLAKHLGHQWSYLGFKERFFNDRYVGRRVVPVVKPGIEKDIAELVASIGDVVHIDECVDVPEQSFETETFDLTKEQERWKQKTIETNPIVRFTKYAQIEQGCLKSDGYEPDAVIPCLKNDRILELVRDHDKLIIVCRYTLQIKVLKEMISTAFQSRNVYVINGETTGDQRDAIVRAADADPTAIVIANAACSEGYELPSFRLIVFASLSLSFKDYQQFLGRNLRINNLRKNLTIHLVSNGVDQAIYDSIMKKQDFSFAIYGEQSTM